MRDILKELDQMERKSLNIGINETGESIKSFSVPWINTWCAMNMKLPDIFFSPEEVGRKDVREKLREFDIFGCYIYVPLSDYSFLKDFTYLLDLHIEQGQNLKSLDFLKEKEKLIMLYLENAKLPDLNILIPFAAPGRAMCLDLKNCHIGEMEDLINDHIIFSELIVEETDSSEEEKRRWKRVRANTFRYFKLKKK